MNTFKTTIGKNAVIVNDNLKGFDLYKKASSNVEYFAIHKPGKQFFIQFNNGTCFVYSDVLNAVLIEAPNAESIGKFYHANIRGRFGEQKVDDRCIRTDLGEIEDDDETYSGDENVDDFLRDSMD